MKTLILIFTFCIPSLLWAGSLQGHWKQDCQIIEGDDVIQVELDVSGDIWKWQGYGFEDEKCKIPYIAYEEVYSAEKVVEIASGKFDLDFIANEISYTPLSREVAEALNMARYCEIQDWKDHQKTLVTGRACDDRQLRRAGDRSYQRIKTVEDGLWWGLYSDSMDGSTPAKRPESYETLMFKR